MSGLKNKDVIIDEENPFLHDALERKESGKALTNFVLTAKEALVLSIDAPWGQGKTTFLKMWQQSLKNNGFPTVYFNAWESDFSDDALICLIGEVGSATSTLVQTKAEASKLKKGFDKLVKASVPLAKRITPIAVKAATLGAIDVDKEYEKLLADLTGSIASDQLKKYSEAKSSITGFKEKLTLLAKDMSDKENPKPLIFIIDELDRCRPNFSIEVLEKAKHFFNVENIVFVLGIDKEQLGSSFRAVYGQGLNVDGYLRRFIDIEYMLPTPGRTLFPKALFEKFSFREFFYENEDAGCIDSRDLDIEAWLSDLFEVFELTLREQEHCCSLLSLAIRVSDSSESIYPIFLCFLIVLKIKHADLYHDFVLKKQAPEILIDSLKDHQLHGIFNKTYSARLEAYILTSNMNGQGYQNQQNRWQQQLRSDNTSSPVGFSHTHKYELKVAKEGIEIIKNFKAGGGTGLLKYLVNKIDLAARFDR